ncbi:MAG TPA: chemotaxis protein CheB, partial [Candidatus Angelobacter sp.]|nr:chemotaxis protein CheB [Candidatus Angelobacter sp.]
MKQRRPSQTGEKGLVPATKIVGIGASAGGLEAFTELLRNLPLDSGIAYILVQHLDPSHRSLLSELLARTTPLRVREIVDHTPVEGNQIYVIPPNSDLALEG